jgi:hypothetical protein
MGGLSELQELLEALVVEDPWTIPFLNWSAQAVTSPYPNWLYQYRSIKDGEMHRFKDEEKLRKFIAKDKDGHRKIVRLALKQGKDVPQEVLDEYPDLGG